MGLGLVVGIAALAVVASRAVVERRQQIGMLRAIGYQRGMVALSFLFESGFIASEAQSSELRVLLFRDSKKEDQYISRRWGPSEDQR